MKNTLLLTLLALLGMTQAAAQEYEYVPFVREGVKWVYYIQNYSDIDHPNPKLPEGFLYYCLEFKGDTVINGKTYKAMHKYHGNAINWENDTVPVYMREENKVVYAIVPDGKKYIDCPLGNRFFSRFNPYSGEEYILYDFNDLDAFWDSILNRIDEQMSMDGNLYHYVGTDSIMINQHLAKRHIGTLDETGPACFYTIEGIGIDSFWHSTPIYFFDLSMGDGVLIFNLSHVIEDGKIIYKGMRYREGAFDGIDEAVADRTTRPADPHHYDLMGRPVGTDVPTAPGIYIHQGKKIIVMQ